MDSFEEASLRRIIAVYDAVLLTITYVDITMQLYVILVMLAATPGKMREYRFFMLLYTLCDLSFAVMVGVVLHPVPTLRVPCSAWRGLLHTLNRHSARIGWPIALFCGTAILAAQDCCIIFRGLVVFQEGRHHHKMETKKARVIAVLVILTLCTIIAFVGYFMTTLGEYRPEDNPALRVALYAGSDAFMCLSMGKTPIYPLPTIILPLAAVMEVTFYGLALATVIYMRKASLKMSQKSKTMNAQLSLLLLLQASTPIICVFVPFVLLLMPLVFSTAGSVVPIMAGFIFVSLFPLVNATLTIAFVRPYRDFTLRLLTNPARKIGGRRRGVFWLSTPEMRVRNRPSISVTAL